MANRSAVAVLVVLAGLLALTGCPSKTQSKGKPDDAQGQSGKGQGATKGLAVRGIEKHLTEDADLVLFKPAGWTVKDAVEGTYRAATVSDPTGELNVQILRGAAPAGANAEGIAGLYLRRLAGEGRQLNVNHAWTRDNRYALSISYAGARGPRECHAWSNLTNGNFVVLACDTPAGQFEPNRSTLLSIVDNVRITKGGAPTSLALKPHRMADGSASFGVPADWRVADLGKGCFIATDPTERYGFMSALAGFITPKWAPKTPTQGIHVADMMPPSQAFQKLALETRIVDAMQILQVRRRPETVGAAGGAILLEDFSFTSSKGGKRSKGFSMAFSQSTPAGVTWGLWHLTVSAPETEFPRFFPTMAAMMESFKVNNQFAEQYVRQGMARVREMERETSANIHRNAEEIRQINTAIYENKCRSQDYLSYAWSQYMRGESDWVSQVEGGKVYRSDSWGLTDRETGGYLEGKHWDYTHFEGDNPRYNETMQEVNSRALYEQYVKGR